jgi:hypothetical protein
MPSRASWTRPHAAPPHVTVRVTVRGWCVRATLAFRTGNRSPLAPSRQGRRHTEGRGGERVGGRVVLLAVQPARGPDGMEDGVRVVGGAAGARVLFPPAASPIGRRCCTDTQGLPAGGHRLCGRRHDHPHGTNGDGGRWRCRTPCTLRPYRCCWSVVHDASPVHTDSAAPPTLERGGAFSPRATCAVFKRVIYCRRVGIVNSARG